MASAEAPIHDNVKQQIVKNSECDSILVFRQFHSTARVARNSISEQIAEISQRPDAAFADVAELASGSRGRAKVLQDGDVEGGMWWASMAQGLITYVDTCEKIVADIVREAEEIMTRRLPALVEATEA